MRAGLKQCLKALNLYVKDVYGPREILAAGIVPDDLVSRIRSSVPR